ncbi:odorant receptor Or2-like [Aphidius gifuensis]|uniref:odorant receptor Or2-like n=1 Tax=Aphidius gifuensis TaxID=684658 RepID=UPI001CDCD306|nr:odorant receptor Or2-like [Aphidius gifuensis]
MISQSSAAVHWHNNKDIMIAAVSPNFFDLISLIKLINNIHYTPKIRKILDCIRKDWITIINDEEKQILHRYAYIGKIIAIGYSGLGYIACFFFIVDPPLTYFYNTMLVPNHSLPETKLYTLPMYFNECDVGIYYFLALFMDYFDTLSLTTVITCNDILFVVIVQHICGQFTILGCRIRKCLSSKSNLTDQYKLIKDCVITHTELIKLSEQVESVYNSCFLLIVGLNVLLLNLTVVQIIISPKLIQTVFKFSIYILIQVLHMCFLCTMSQQLINHSLQLSESIYKAMWYTKSLKIQKTCMLMILRSQVPCQLTAGKMIPLSLESFAKILKTTASYQAVFLSMD